jgi:hypothetical protein
MKKFTVNVPEMEEATKPLFQSRNFQGYFQYLETFGTDDNGNYCWRFYISGFSSDNSDGYILKWDQTYEIIPIDQHDRILINGKYYRQRYWNH